MRISAILWLLNCRANLDHVLYERLFIFLIRPKFSIFTWKSQWKDSPTSGHPMEPCGSGSLHARSRVMLHLNSHSSRATTSNSSVGRTAPTTVSTVDTRQKSCPNIFHEDQCQNEGGNPRSCFSAMVSRWSASKRCAIQ